MKDANKMSVGQPERKRHVWDDNINVNLIEVSY
jgi:hypothetical protein